MKDGKSSDSILGIDIKEIQKIELEMLLEFDRICKKHGIKYQLFAGSLIGAIRHQGFIPWDDDIDVCMLRSEYNKFLAVVEKELQNQYFFQTYKTDLNYMNKFAKFRKNGTVFKEMLVREVDMHHGVYIDIFALDNIEPNTLRGKFQIWQIRAIDSFFKHRLRVRHANMEPGFKKFNSKLKYHLIKIIPIEKVKVENFVMNIMKRFNNIETKYVADLSNPGKGNLEKFIIEKDVFDNSIEWEFEGHLFPIPRDYDKILTKAYGDYMKMPDEFDRVSHHNIVEIDLNLDK